MRELGFNTLISYFIQEYEFCKIFRLFQLLHSSSQTNENKTLYTFKKNVVFVQKLMKSYRFLYYFFGQKEAGVIGFFVIFYQEKITQLKSGVDILNIWKLLTNEATASSLQVWLSSTILLTQRTQAQISQTTFIFSSCLNSIEIYYYIALLIKLKLHFNSDKIGLA